MGADEQEGKRDFRSASARSRAAKADRVIAEARAGESPLRHHRNTQRESGLTPGFLFSYYWLCGLNMAC